MPQIHPLLSAHHKHCDEIFSAAEEAAQSRSWPACEEACARFAREILAHFEAEESLLFPAFENATGMTMGPTRVMRQEHVQMRGLLEQMEAAAGAHDVETFGGVAETLLILMQQHNMKEENILYPMCDQSLAAEVDALATQLDERLRAATCPLPA